MKKTFALLVMGFALSAVLMTIPSFGAGDAGKRIAGEAFTDPGRKFPMPEDWKRKPVKPQDWDKGADITIMLEQDVYQTIKPLIMDYVRETGVRVSLKEGTCGIAAGMLANKTVDMGGFCCAAGYEDRLPGLKYHTLGIVSVAFLVNPQNPVRAVTLDQLRDIYRGKIYRWSEIKTPTGAPGPAEMIKAVARLHCEKRPGHWRLMLGENKDFGPKVSEVNSIPDMISAVATSREAIGWEVLSMVDRYKDLGAVRPLKINGYPPTDTEALAALKYPVYRVYTITTWEGAGEENKKGLALVEYLKRKMRSIDPARYGFVSDERLRRAGWKFVGDELVGEPR